MRLGFGCYCPLHNSISQTHVRTCAVTAGGAPRISHRLKEFAGRGRHEAPGSRPRASDLGSGEVEKDGQHLPVKRS